MPKACLSDLCPEIVVLRELITSVNLCLGHSLEIVSDRQIESTVRVLYVYNSIAQNDVPHAALSAQEPTAYVS
jgi:hypothetical protein